MTKPAEKLFPDIAMIPATAEQEPTVANLLELYAHDFSEFHPLEVDGPGKFWLLVSPALLERTWPISFSCKNGWQLGWLGFSEARIASLRRSDCLGYG
jgi:hypothetical protein